MADIARLGLSVDSSQIEKGTVSLNQLTGAAGQASAAAQRLAGTSQAEAAGQKVATTAVQAHTAALAVQNNVMRSSMQQRTMMIYQLNDVAVSLASGMNPAMVAMQQGSQILQGGLMPAINTLGDLVIGTATKFAPLLAVVGGLTILLQGMTNEINSVSGANVSLMDTTLAVFESISSGVQTVLGPAMSWLQTEWDNAINQIFADTAREVNAIIGLWVGSVDAIKAAWDNLPAALGFAIYEASKNTVNGVIYMIREVQVQFNKLMGWVDTQMLALGAKPLGIRGDLAGYITMPNPYQDGAESAGAAGEAFNAAQGKDYVGDWMAGVGKRAQEIAAARKETEDLGGAAKAANDNIKAMDDSAKSMAETWGGTLKSAWQGFFSDFNNGLKQGKGFWDALGEAGMNALSKITDKALEMATNGIWDMLFGTLFGGGFPSPTGFSAGGTGFLGGGASSWGPSFDGGGSTGNGPRSGGVDGKGGFPAILHPRETVLDHTKGQAANSNSLSVVRIELSGDIEARILQQSGQQSVQIVQAAAPSISEQGSKGAGSMLAGGDFDRSMSRFGVQPVAKVR